MIYLVVTYTTYGTVRTTNIYEAFETKEDAEWFAEDFFLDDYDIIPIEFHKHNE